VGRKIALVMSYDPTFHHRRSIRLPHYDYRQEGAYFVTLCTFGRAHIFEDAKLRDIAAWAWRRVVLHGRGRIPDEFVIMPDHVHGIVWIAAANPRRRPRLAYPGTSYRVDQEQGAMAEAPGPALRVASGSLGAIVRAFKSATARRINTIRGTPGGPVWQRNYYERVIRDEEELAAVRRYIRENPLRWEEDQALGH
jgi:REP element-mobilizing transposase RayT